MVLFFFLNLLYCLQAGSGKRRKGRHGQGSGAAAEQRRWSRSRPRGLEGEGRGEDSGGAAGQGAGQKPTFSEQEMPGAATPNGAGAPLTRLLKWSTDKDLMAFPLLLGWF